jgi:hypothetical protein
MFSEDIRQRLAFKGNNAGEPVITDPLWFLNLTHESSLYEWSGYIFDIEYSARVPMREEPTENQPVVEVL